jgi:BirA family biotin operon repressor/biotin-[acetyl-CoA-carboxylase] ligase
VRLHRHDLLGSTNDEALRLAGEGAPHGTVVAARQQSAGRGRQGRRWVSPPGNLHASFLFRSGCFQAAGPARVSELGFVAAVATAAAIDGFVAGCRLKWPNDALLGGAKVAGILIEMVGDAVVVGIGVNVAHAPPGMPYPVTSLAEHGASPGVDAVLDAVIAALDAGVSAWDASGFRQVREAWLRRGPALGDALTARAGPGVVSGRFAGLDADGALLLRTADGVQRIVAGEVVGA